MPREPRDPWPWQEEDHIRLRHMLDAARQIESFVASHTRQSLRQDDLTTLGLLKAIEIIGEAAVAISEPVRDAIPQLPWAQIIGMRHRLVHAYFDVDLDIAWATASKAVPALASHLHEFLARWRID